VSGFWPARVSLPLSPMSEKGALRDSNPRLLVVSQTGLSGVFTRQNAVGVGPKSLQLSALPLRLFGGLGYLGSLLPGWPTVSTKGVAGEAVQEPPRTSRGTR